MSRYCSINMNFLLPLSHNLGPWKPPQIDNPNYQGEWVHPQIDNPEYEPDDTLYKFDDFGVIGFDLWQVQRYILFLCVLNTAS